MNGGIKIKGQIFRLKILKHILFKKLCGPKSEYFIKSCMRFPDFFTNLEPMPGAIDGMKSLIDMGHDVKIASKTPLSAGVSYHGKIEWIRKHLPFFNLNNFVALQKKHFLIGDVLLDDSASNIEEFRNTGREAVVFDRPWNRNVSGKRVKTWDEFVNMVKQQSKFLERVEQ